MTEGMKESAETLRTDTEAVAPPVEARSYRERLRAAAEVDDAPEATESRTEQLTPDEEAAVTDYTRDGYEDMNRALRHPEFSTPEIDRRCEALSRGLQKLPVHEGVVLRGTDLDESVVSRYEPDMVVQEAAFTSASKDSPFPGNTQFRILSRTGRDVGEHAFYPESEVLFDRNTKFLVLDHQVQDGVHRIYMQEV